MEKFWVFYHALLLAHDLYNSSTTLNKTKHEGSHGSTLSGTEDFQPHSREYVPNYRMKGNVAHAYVQKQSLSCIGNFSEVVTQRDN
jgi:hypothetical protein